MKVIVLSCNSKKELFSVITTCLAFSSYHFALALLSSFYACNQDNYWWASLGGPCRNAVKVWYHGGADRSLTAQFYFFYFFFNCGKKLIMWSLPLKIFNVYSTVLGTICLLLCSNRTFSSRMTKTLCPPNSNFPFPSALRPWQLPFYFLLLWVW